MSDAKDVFCKECGRAMAKHDARTWACYGCNRRADKSELEQRDTNSIAVIKEYEA
jgi:hypothetical protein